MIIVSQDKTDLINFDNVSWLYVEPNNFTINVALKYGDSVQIAEYETEERAKEILKDIVLRYEAIELCKKESPEILGYTLADYTPVYEMPKE